MVAYIYLQEKLLVPFGTKHLDAALTVPAESSNVRTAMILTHGAGGDMNFKHLVSMAHAAASKGIVCLRFTCRGLNFAYRLKAYHAVWVRINKYSKMLQPLQNPKMT